MVVAAVVLRDQEEAARPPFAAQVELALLEAA
jgi:hypothetical protein